MNLRAAHCESPFFRLSPPFKVIPGLTGYPSLFVQPNRLLYNKTGSQIIDSDKSFHSGLIVSTN